MIRFSSKLISSCGKVLLITALSLWYYSTAIADQPVKTEESAADTKKLEIGKQIYLNGQLPSGKVIQAIAAGDSPVSGDQFTCVSCHRRSRLGSSEGGKQVPPLTATALFRPAEVSVTRGVLPKAFKHVGSSRIPYTDETLAKAIRDGVDPSGRKLDPLMPRYVLDDEAIAALTAYLKKESTATPGVDDSTLHFATVVTEGVDPAKRKAMLDILTGYFQDKNANTRHNTKRAKFSAYKMYQVYRKWELHVWELKGEESSWSKQLENYYQTQPVLAMVGGLSASGWQPIHQFCEQFEVACLFPNTSVPVISGNDFYTTYFSKGVTLEAEVLAYRLRNVKDKSKNRSITQIFRDSGEGKVAAAALHDALLKSNNTHLQDISITGSQKLVPAFWHDLFKKPGSDILVLWLNQKDIETLGDFKELPAGITAIYGSVSLMGEQLPKLTDAAIKKLFLIYPWELPDAREAQLMRVKSWLKSKHIPFEDERLQANTFLQYRHWVKLLCICSTISHHPILLNGLKA